LDTSRFLASILKKELTQTGAIPTGGKEPRHFTSIPPGIFSSGKPFSDTIVAFHVDATRATDSDWRQRRGALAGLPQFIAAE